MKDTSSPAAGLKTTLLPRSLSLLAVVGLAAGFGLGLLLSSTENAALLAMGRFLDPLGTIWVNAIRAAVIPLVVSYVITSVASIGEAKRTGELAGFCLLTFLGLVVLAALYSVPLGHALASAYTVDAEMLTALRTTVSGTADVTTAAVPLSFGQTLIHLMPANLFRAAAEEQILALVIAALIFGLATTQVGPESKEILTRFFRAVAEATMVVVVWILWLMPIGVFALAYTAASETGVALVWAFGYWIVVASAILFGFTLLLYPIARMVGRVDVRRFARAVAPAQLVAVSARSSLVAIPALLDGARTHLGFPAAIRGFAIPFSSATFKLSGMLGSPFQLFLLARLYGVDLDPATVAVFVAGIMLLSFGTPGIPSAGFSVRLPMFVAAGIPVEGFLLMAAMDTIPDMFKTMANVTGDMTVLSIVARLAGVASSQTPAVDSESR